MSIMQTFAGGSALVLAGSVLLRAVLPDPAPIRVHDLYIEAGMVHQDRTVEADGPVFYATWEAQVLDMATGDPVPWCSGSGSWNYKVGRATYSMTLERWTGRDECSLESLPPGTYLPVASWYWGADQTSHQGQPFGV